MARDGCAAEKATRVPIAPDERIAAITEVEKAAK